MNENPRTAIDVRHKIQLFCPVHDKLNDFEERMVGKGGS